MSCFACQSITWKSVWRRFVSEGPQPAAIRGTIRPDLLTNSSQVRLVAMPLWRGAFTLTTCLRHDLKEPAGSFLRRDGRHGYCQIDRPSVTISRASATQGALADPRRWVPSERTCFHPPERGAMGRAPNPC